VVTPKLWWLGSFVLRLVVVAGDFVAGNVFVALIYLTLISGIVVGFVTRLASLLAQSFRRGYRYGHTESFKKHQ
jgi:hypothetical protein